jgi:hypothetical protein
MNPHQNAQAGRADSLPGNNAHFSWRNSQGQLMSNTEANMRPQTVPDPTNIDPQLRNEHVFHGADLLPSRQLYPVSFPPTQIPMQPLSHSRTSSLQIPSTEEPSPRHLPSQEVTDSNFDDAYVAFIFYCNPSIPDDTPTQELRTAFRSPPKSDGKNFSTFVLFELIRKLELKELKTWAQLAIELGVEPPVIDKGQSAQKVQQYAVRLKVRIMMRILNLKSDSDSALDACYACGCFLRISPQQKPCLLDSSSWH